MTGTGKPLPDRETMCVWGGHGFAGGGMKAWETDILVIGSGPAGSVLAHDLAAGGQVVTVMDRADHPRHKPCGGGLPARTCAHLPLTPEEVEGWCVREVVLDGGVRGRHGFDASGTWVVDRSRFDAALLRRACARGARFHPHTGYVHAKRVPGGFVVTTTRGEFRARVLCACDGVFSRVARDFGVPRPGYGFCLEGVVPYAPGTTEAARHRAVFRLTAVARGYGWAFPRADGYAVGVGGDFSRKPDLRRALEAFCRKTPELFGQPLDVRGGMLPAYGGALAWYAREGVYLCGDAARLVDRLTGEGIYYAIRSGGLAATALLGGSGAEERYDAAVRSELVTELEYARRCAARVHARHPWTMAVLMGLPRFRRYAGMFVGLLGGTLTYADLFARLHRRGCRPG